MQHVPRRILRAAGVLTLTGALLAAGQLLVAALDPGPTAAPSVTRAATLADSITGLQRELERLPANDASWAQLGAAYVEQVRRTADPTFYDRAEGAFIDSLRLRALLPRRAGVELRRPGDGAKR